MCSTSRASTSSSSDVPRPACSASSERTASAISRRPPYPTAPLTGRPRQPRAGGRAAPPPAPGPGGEVGRRPRPAAGGLLGLLEDGDGLRREQAERADRVQLPAAGGGGGAAGGGG